jgi:hypothetical protein
MQMLMMSWYGDAAPAIAEQKATENWLQLLVLLSQGGGSGLPDSSSLGDCNWAGDTENVPEGLATAWLCWNAALLQRVFDTIGRSDLADSARVLGGGAASAYAQYVNSSGKVSSGSQMTQALALWFDIIRDDGVARLASVVLEQQVDAAAGHVHGGIFTMKALAAVAGRCIAIVTRHTALCILHARRVGLGAKGIALVNASDYPGYRCITRDAQAPPLLLLPTLPQVHAGQRRHHSVGELEAGDRGARHSSTSQLLQP